MKGFVELHFHGDGNDLALPCNIIAEVCAAVRGGTYIDTIKGKEYYVKETFQEVLGLLAKAT